MIHTIIRILLFTFFSLQVSATEVDSFTDRDPLLKDALCPLNDLMNDYFKEAILIANQKNSCNPVTISKALIKHLGRLGWNKIEIDIEHSELIDKRRSLRENSIYQHVLMKDAWALWLAKLGFIIRINDTFVGSDKFGHFIQQGYYYFEEIYIKNKTLKDAFDYGEMTERTYYGLETTGVYSYGDLAANYDGLLFWERMSGLNLPPNTEPYFACENNTWRQISNFSWTDYITTAWDEGINCSRYVSQHMTDSVNTNIANLEKKRFARYQCPNVEKNICKSLIEHYGNVAEHFITDKCF